MQAKDLMVEDFETVFGGMSVQDLVDEYILKKRERVFMVSYADKLAGNCGPRGCQSAGRATNGR